MISSFTFKQENVTGAKPYRELLLYLNNKLDEAVAKARLPSGQNPLEQLVLIIGDGRLHEKVIYIFFFDSKQLMGNGFTDFPLFRLFSIFISYSAFYVHIHCHLCRI